MPYRHGDGLGPMAGAGGLGAGRVPWAEIFLAGLMNETVSRVLVSVSIRATWRHRDNRRLPDSAGYGIGR